MKETGKLDFPLTNDYMFRALLQKNEKVLKALICSLLHLENNDSITAEITNPIILGESTNYMMNMKNHKIYSDKFCIHVLSLNQIHLATEEDKAYGIDYWARLFKASTWKELKEMVADNPITDDAAETLHEILKDMAIRDQIYAREEYNM